MKSKKEREDNAVHIKFEYIEAVEFKKEILNLEALLLKAVKKIDSYKDLRSRELDLKIVLYKKLKELKSFVSSTQKSFPKIETPELKKEAEIEEEEQSKSKVKRGRSIEEQLKEIQKRLEELQSKSV